MSRSQRGRKTLKTLAIICHGREENGLIAKSQFTEIVDYGIPGLNEIIAGHNGSTIIHLGSEYRKTEQTSKAFGKYLDTKTNYNFGGHMFYDLRFGSRDMFKRLTSNAKIVAEAEKTNWYKAFLNNDPKFIKRVQDGLLMATEEAFLSSTENSLTICACHTPLIEWLAYRLDPEKKISRDTKLKELSGFIITQEKEKISVTGTIGF